jgi:predicted aspartyl protease
MALGPIDSHNVRAMVAESDLPVSLLGQSFLERVGTVEISGNELRLR